MIRYRSPEPVLTPELPQERIGTVANVVFPTAIDRRDDLGLPDRFDVYYGMADNRIGVARLDVPEFLPPGALADPSRAKGSFQIDGQSQTESRQDLLGIAADHGGFAMKGELAESATPWGTRSWTSAPINRGRTRSVASR